MRCVSRLSCAALSLILLLWGVAGLSIRPAFAAPFFFSTGDPDGRMATGSRPPSPGKIEIESADDFILNSTTQIDSATFTGLLPLGFPLPGIEEVRVEIYRVFPQDSTSPPSGRVPTRVNSPSDVKFDARDTAAGSLTFSAADLGVFVVSNTVLNGIHPVPNQQTGGEGPASGEEVQLNAQFTTPLTLPADHYFFVPQVQLSSGDFLWLSAPRPIVPPGTPFSPDLEEWIRNADLAPDWLRVGTDIVGGTTFNATFSLTGETVPEPSTVLLMLSGLSLLAWRGTRARPRPPVRGRAGRETPGGSRH